MKVGKSVKKGYNQLSNRAKKILLIAIIILSIFFFMGFIIALPMLMFLFVIFIQIGIPVLFTYLAFKFVSTIYYMLKGYKLRKTI